MLLISKAIYEYNIKLTTNMTEIEKLIFGFDSLKKDQKQNT